MISMARKNRIITRRVNRMQACQGSLRMDFSMSTLMFAFVMYKFVFSLCNIRASFISYLKPNKNFLLWNYVLQYVAVTEFYRSWNRNTAFSLYQPTHKLWKVKNCMLTWHLVLTKFIYLIKKTFIWSRFKLVETGFQLVLTGSDWSYTT